MVMKVGKITVIHETIHVTPEEWADMEKPLSAKISRNILVPQEHIEYVVLSGSKPLKF